MSPWLDQKDAAERLCLSPFTLRNWRNDGRGPRFYRVGSRIIYKASDLDAFVEAHASRTVVLSGQANVGLSRARDAAS